MINRFILNLLLSIILAGGALSAQNSGQINISDNDKPENQNPEQDSTYEYLLRVIENTDIGFIWGGDLSQQNRLGFIGDDFQRIRIRFLSVIQNFDNPYEYFMYGKSNVRDNICEFQGSVQITEVSIIQDDKYPDFIRVYIGGNYALFEDQSCLHSGIFRGNFDSFVYLDQEGTVFYDNLELNSDSYANNQFFGVWEEYFDEDVRTCNWGDHRIPFSTGLDMGGEEFRPSFQYIDNGWEDFREGKSDMEKEVDTLPWWN